MARKHGGAISRNTYLRGRLPNWLVEKMSANGNDPSSAEQRAQFKEQHLVKVAA